MRSPSRQARTVTAGAELGDRDVAGRLQRASTSQSPKRARPGTASSTGAGGSASAARREPKRPVLGDRPEAAAEVERLRPLRSRAPGASSSSRRARAASAPGQRGAAPGRWSAAELAQRVERTRAGPPPSSSSASATAASSTSASSRSWRAVSAIVRSAAGRQLAQRVEHVVADAGAREAAVGVRGVLAPLEPAGAQVVAHLVARHLQQRPHEPPAARRHAVQRPRAGRDGQPVQHRLRLVGCGVGGGVVAVGEPARRASSARRARAPGGCPRRAASRART